jgi:hypothetical protein
MRRSLSTAALVVATLIGPAAPAWAHGVGARGDLPLPLWSVLYGAVAVLAFSFLALVRMWPEPRLEAPRGGVALPAGADPLAMVAEVVGRLVGTLLLAVVVIAGLQDSDLPAYALFIGVWVAVPILAAVLGDVWSLLNPFAGLAALLDRAGVGTSPAWLERAGRLPAAVLLLAFGWLELAHPDPADPDVVLGFIGVYAAVLVLGGIWWGRAWIERADAFGVYFGLVGRLGIIQRDDTGTLRLRAPLVGLSRVEPVRGTALVVLVALGVTSFDGLTRSTSWESLLGRRTGWEAAPLSTLGLLAMVAIVTVAYYASMAAASRVVDEPTPRLVEVFAHSLVPISLGYAVAHYFSLLAFDGQLFLGFVSDPLGMGWDLFGTAGRTIDFTLVSTETIAFVQVAAIVVGHVAGVVLAHDRAVARYPADVAGPSQHALFGAMVLYTVGGLVLLLGV